MFKFKKNINLDDIELVVYQDPKPSCLTCTHLRSRNRLHHTYIDRIPSCIGTCYAHPNTKDLFIGMYGCTNAPIYVTKDDSCENYNTIDYKVFCKDCKHLKLIPEEDYAQNKVAENVIGYCHHYLDFRTGDILKEGCYGMVSKDAYICIVIDDHFPCFQKKD